MSYSYNQFEEYQSRPYSDYAVPLQHEGYTGAYTDNIPTNEGIGQNVTREFITNLYNKIKELAANVASMYSSILPMYNALKDITLLKGEKGDKGDTGTQGPAGQDGADGQDGAQGPQGPQGPTGPQGPQGPAGETPSLAGYATETYVNNTAATLQSNFQDGVDSVYDAIVIEGTTPSSQSLDDVVDGVHALASDKWNTGYSSGIEAGIEAGKTSWKPEAATLSNAGQLTVNNTDGTTVYSTTFGNNYNSGYTAGSNYVYSNQKFSYTKYVPSGPSGTYYDFTVPDGYRLLYATVNTMKPKDSGYVNSFCFADFYYRNQATNSYVWASARSTNIYTPIVTSFPSAHANFTKVYYNESTRVVRAVITSNTNAGSAEHWFTVNCVRV